MATRTKNLDSDDSLYIRERSSREVTMNVQSILFDTRLIAEQEEFADIAMFSSL